MYFDNMNTLDEVKVRYKILAKRLHPDAGGDTAIMQEINEDYQTAILRITKPEPMFFHETPKQQVKGPRQKLERVLAWADNNPSFDDTFVCSLLHRLETGRELTDAQVNALDNIIKKFKIDTTGD